MRLKDYPVSVQPAKLVLSVCLNQSNRCTYTSVLNLTVLIVTHYNSLDPDLGFAIGTDIPKAHWVPLPR